MQLRFSFLALLFSALLLLASPVFSAGGTTPSRDGVSPRCEAAIDKAAGRYSQCLLKASAKFAKKKNQDDRLFAQQMRCGDKFDNQVARAQDRYGEEQCTPYTNQIADRTATYAEATTTEARWDAGPLVSFCAKWHRRDAFRNDPDAYGCEPQDRLVYGSSLPGRRADADRRFRSGLGRWRGLICRNDPPNAEFSCEVDNETVNYVVELMAPSLEGTDLTYEVESVGDQALPTALECDSASHLFIDSLGIRHVDTPTLPTGDSSCQSYCGCYKGKERENGKSCQSANDNLIWSEIGLCKSHTKDSCGKTLRHTCAWNVALFSVGDNSCAMSAPQYQTDEDRKEQKIADWNQEKNNQCKSYCGCREGKLQARMEEDDFGQQTGEIGLYCEGERYNAGPPPITALESCTRHTSDGKDNCKRQPYCAWHKATESDQACSWNVIK